MSNGLSAQDIEVLLKAATPPEVAARRLAGSVAKDMLTPAERAVAEDVLRHMLGEAALKVRQVLAEALKDTPLLPHDIAVRLANDVESVAIPVLQFSSVLTDEDLIAIIRAGAPEKQIAVAGRPTVSTAVAGELLASDNNRAVVRLLDNEGARLDDTQLERAATRFGSDPRVAERLASRPDLPIALAERMTHFTAETLSAYLLRRHADLPEAVITQLVIRTREQATVDLRSPHSSADEAIELARHLHGVDRLTPSLALRALCVGDLSLFEAALAELAQVPITNARLLIHDPGPLGLRSICDKAGIPPHLLSAIRVALQVQHETLMDGEAFDRERYRRAMLERILTQFQVLDAEDLDYLLIRLEDPNPVAPAGTA